MLGRSAWQRWELFTQSVPIFAAIYSVNEAPDALSHYVLRTNSGSLAIAAIRRASFPMRTSLCCQWHECEPKD
jgi:hypothetical protein